jgi:hypothetical protein
MVTVISINPKQENDYFMIKEIDWGKELWHLLFFGCIGFTVWPLIVYYLGQTIQVVYFINLPLRTWAEQKVYGPLSYFNFRSLISLTFLFFPLLTSIAIRILLNFTRK